MDNPNQTPPEVTIEPADNGFIVRHQQRSTKKNEPSRTIRRLAMTADEALDHAKSALSGGGKISKKKYIRDGQSGAGMSDTEGETGSSSSPAAHSARSPRRNSSRRRRSRIGGRR